MTAKQSCCTSAAVLVTAISIAGCGGKPDAPISRLNTAGVACEKNVTSPNFMLTLQADRAERDLIAIAHKYNLSERASWFGDHSRKQTLRWYLTTNGALLNCASPDVYHRLVAAAK
jgi:hypothetical protein